MARWAPATTPSSTGPDAPAGSKTFAMTSIDTTLGAGSQFGQHWAIWNILGYRHRQGDHVPRGTDDVDRRSRAAKQRGKVLTPCAQSVMNNMDDQYAFTLLRALDRRR